MRYGSENVDLGPGVEDDVSTLRFLELGADVSETTGGGGGSIIEAAGDGLERGSPSDGMASSADDVSIVICLVTGGACRNV